LASKLGLSPTTVSRALNGYPEVNEATRERVMAAAKRHNYRPNTRAIRLATGRAMAVGHVIPIATRHEIVNPVFADFIAGAGEIYSRAGYDMVLSVVPDEDEERTYRDLHARGTVDGIIVHAPRMNDPRMPLLTSIGFPFVVHGRATGTTNCPIPGST
jgi:LacI family transcriptional regulator